MSNQPASDPSGMLATGRPEGYWQLRVEHARSQGAANGFQQGWHAALKRVSDGDHVETLADLVPKPVAASPSDAPVTPDQGSQIDAAIAKIMARRTAASGLAVFVDDVILRDILTSTFMSASRSSLVGSGEDVIARMIREMEALLIDYSPGRQSTFDQIDTWRHQLIGILPAPPAGITPPPDEQKGSDR